MSVARISRPKLLDPSLRLTQKPVDQKSVGIGRYLRRDSRRQASEYGGQSLPEPEHALEARQGNLYVLPYAAGRLPERSLGNPMPIQKQFNKKLNIYQVQSVLANYVLQ